MTDEVRLRPPVINKHEDTLIVWTTTVGIVVPDTEEGRGKIEHCWNLALGDFADRLREEVAR